HTSLKIVIFNDKDLQFAKQVTQRYPLIPLYLQVGNEDLDQSDNDQLTRQLLNAYEWLIRQTMAEKALNHARVLPQMHALVWGNRRGVSELSMSDALQGIAISHAMCSIGRMVYFDAFHLLTSYWHVR